jgi:ATP-dependent Clp protease, protease subunit
MQQQPQPAPQPQLPPPIVYVSFSAEIVPATTESLIAVMADCANKGVPHVYLMLSTPGGSVMHGLNLYNVLRAMPFKLTTHNVGNVDSIGNAIFLAGEERFSCPQSTFMFHGVGFGTNPGERLEEKTLKGAAR